MKRTYQFRYRRKAVREDPKKRGLLYAGTETGMFVTGKKQPAFLGVFADCTYKRVLWNAAYDFRPALAVVVGLIDVRTQVVILVAVNRQVGSSSIVRRRFDQADAAPFRQVLRSYVRPTLAAIPGDLNDAVVSARPD